MFDFLKHRLLVRLQLNIENIFAEAYINYLSALTPITFQSSLDVGAGRGVFCKHLMTRGVDAYGIERSTKSVQESIITKIRCGTFDTTYVPTRKYDLISLTQVIYFVGPVPDVLQHVKKFLNPGGFLFIVTAIKPTREHSEQYPHHQFYSKSEYYDLAKDLDFEILDFSNFHSRLGVAFTDGFYRGLLRMVAFNCGFLEANVRADDGNHTYILMRLR